LVAFKEILAHFQSSGLDDPPFNQKGAALKPAAAGGRKYQAAPAGSWVLAEFAQLTFAANDRCMPPIA
jgi:hypothetical protein